MLTQDPLDVRSAPEAAALAGVSYRQLDYWTRKGWIVPAEIDRVSPGRVVRRYGAVQILQCALLAHLGGSGLDVTPYGPQVGELELGPEALVVIDADGRLEVVDAPRLRSRVGARGRYVVFDPAPVLRRLGRQDNAAGGASRKTA
ncbi:MAG: MerR family transcriptional regulator [Acidimicrobiales bacterium]